MPDNNTKLVYSTERAIPRKEKSAGKDLEENVHPADQKVRVRLDRKGRGGKSVTVIEGLRMTEKNEGSLLRQLKGKLGTGGAVKDSCIEIQGDHCDTLLSALKKLGYQPKRSGG